MPEPSDAVLGPVSRSRPRCFGALEDAIVLAERILDAFAPAIDLGGAEARTTPSIGIALSNTPDAMTDLVDLLRRADSAMYRAKAGGKARYALFDPALDTGAAPG